MTRKAWIVALVVFGLLWLLLALRTFDCVPVGSVNDDAGYLLVAQHFLRTGDLTTTGADPIGSAAPYLPGQPLILALLSAVSGGNWTVMHFLCVLITAATAILYLLLARARLDHKSATLFVIAFLMQPLTYVFGSSFLSDMNFAFVTASVLVLYDRLGPRDRASAFTIGLLSGFGTLVRASGVVMAAALVFSLLVRKQRINATMTALGSVIVAGSYFFLCPIEAQAPYGKMMAEFSYGACLSYLWTWLSTASNILASFFLPWRPWGLLALGCVSVLAIVGARAEWRENGGSSLVLFPVLYLTSLLPWPYLLERYFLCWWPLVLIMALRPLSRKFRLALLCLFIAGDLAQVPTMLALSDYNKSIEIERTLCYDWLRTRSEPNAVILASNNVRVSLYSARTAVPSFVAPRECDYLLLACRQGAGYLLVEPLSMVARDVFGRPETNLAPRLDLWLDRSTLVRPVCRNATERVYRREISAGRFMAAYQHFLVASAYADDRPDVAVREVGTALRQVSDFPEARRLHAGLLFNSGQGDRAARLLLQEVVQYPVDMEAALQLARMLWSLGNRGAALQVLQDARVRAATLSFESDVARIDALRRTLEER